MIDTEEKRKKIQKTKELKVKNQINFNTLYKKLKNFILKKEILKIIYKKM